LETLLKHVLKKRPLPGIPGKGLVCS